jgi:AcrR family transcriptional regulator
LAAALELFVEKGFAATRSEEVAKRAGVSKGTLYLYYPSKDELFKAVVRNNLTPMIAAGSDLLQSFEGSARELIDRLLSRWWQDVGSTSAAGIVKLIIAEAGNFPELADFYRREVLEPGRALVTQVIHRGISRGEFRQVNADLAAHALFAPLQYVVINRYTGGMYGCGNDLPSMQACLLAQVDLLVHGLELDA